MAYTDAATLKTYLGASGSGDDTLLTALIARAQQAIETFCGRKFEASIETRYFDVPKGEGDYWVDGVKRSGFNARTLYLDGDLISITTLTNGDATTIASTEYKLLPLNLTPKYAIMLKQSSNVIWEDDSDGNTEGVISVAGS